MTASTEWKLAPDGPPPSISSPRTGMYQEMLAWCDEHPGQWVVYASRGTGNSASKFVAKGYEAKSRKVDENVTNVYVRRPPVTP